MRMLRAIRRITPPAVVAGLLCWLGMTSDASAQDKTVNLKLSTWVPPAHPLNPSLQAWAADIEKESGVPSIDPVPVGAIGKAMDHYDMARDGIADFAYVNPGYQPGRFPIIAAAEMPFLLANAKGGSAGLDAWYRPYAPQEMKDVHFCFAFALDPAPGTPAPRRSCCRGTSRHEGPPGQCDVG